MQGLSSLLLCAIVLLHVVIALHVNDGTDVCRSFIRIGNSNSGNSGSTSNTNNTSNTSNINNINNTSDTSDTSDSRNSGKAAKDSPNFDV